jgi:hypothetical protein
MMGRMVLPLAGGAPAVWTTCLMFFQAALLGGYLYAHLTDRWLSARSQRLLHAVVLLAPLALLPAYMSPAWGAPDPGHPVPWLFMRLLRSIGLPFMAVAANAPLVQRWFSETRHPSSRDPYFLYAASNVGSLSGLLAYPLLIEPNLTLAHQSALWTAGFGLLIAMTWGVMALGQSSAIHTVASTAPAVADLVPPATRGQRAKWVLLSFVPSTLMLSVTTYISTDIAAVPLLWVVPLGLYLVTFILTFARRPLISHRLMVTALPFVIIPPVLTILMNGGAPPQVLIPLHLLGLFAAGMVCHGELVRARPPAEHLTGFYLWISAGGVAGGIFGTLVAPVIFTTPLEYPLAILLACAVRPAADGSAKGRSPLDAAPIGVAIIIAILMTAVRILGLPPTELRTLALIFLPAMLTCALAAPQPRAFAAGLAVVLVAGLGWQRLHTRSEHIERNFFGVQSVEITGGGRFRAFIHGSTIHGTQALDPAMRREPTTYYSRSGPAGQVLAELSTPGRRFAGVGLGAGTLASYATNGEHWTFYEINPAVERLASDPRWFTYLADCGNGCEVVIADARLALARAPAGGYDAIVLDAFSSDAIPMHLLTREAVAIYLRALAPRGVLLFHLSNRFLDLRPVVAGLGADAGLMVIGRTDRDIGADALAAGTLGSSWALAARTREDLGPVTFDVRWTPLSPNPRIGVWTDDFSNIFAVLRLRRGGPFANPRGD